MIRKVFATAEEFKTQNMELGTKLPYAEDVSVLGTELKVGSKIIKNRLACQPMEGCDGTADGSPDEVMIRRYDRFAKGGAGLIWFEATAVMEEGRANPRQLWMHEGNKDAFKRQVERIKETAMKENGYEPVVIMQATHSGRYSKPNGVPAPIIAYNNPLFEKDNPIPAERIATDEHIDRIGEALVKAAKMAEEVGFDGVDIKACHRYINCELLSAYERPGKYGGSLENRTRLLRESIAGAMEVCSSGFIVSSRMNVYDGFPYPYGFGVKTDGSLDFDPTEPVWLLKQLQAMGVEIVDITMGNPYVNPHVNRPFAVGGYQIEEHPLEGVARMLHGIAALKKEVPDLKIVSSALTYLGAAAPNVLAALIKEGGCDIGGFGRMTFAYPDFAKDIVKNGCLNKEQICICCSKCSEIMRTPGGTPGCVIRDRELYLPLYQKLCMNK
ncbi:MAG: flavin oxidoreductase/NADH oxidase [Lachnospiraceae bacterium]|nr:flavin oxidoreductase/NADH oxidase [Lachnospiraceae bacterium]